MPFLSYSLEKWFSPERFSRMVKFESLLPLVKLFCQKYICFSLRKTFQSLFAFLWLPFWTFTVIVPKRRIGPTQTEITEVKVFLQGSQGRLMLEKIIEIIDTQTVILGLRMGFFVNLIQRFWQRAISKLIEHVEPVHETLRYLIIGEIGQSNVLYRLKHTN